MDLVNLREPNLNSHMKLRLRITNVTEQPAKVRQENAMTWTGWAGLVWYDRASWNI